MMNTFLSDLVADFVASFIICLLLILKQVVSKRFKLVSRNAYAAVQQGELPVSEPRVGDLGVSMVE